MNKKGRTERGSASARGTRHPGVRTSTTDPIDVAWLLDELPGKIGITLAPGKHAGSKSGARWERDLAADLDLLVERHGMGVQVCLLEDQELVRLKIGDLVEEAERRGVAVLRLPIPDGGVLPSGEPVEQVVEQILAAASAGKNVVIHCMGGLGRAGTIGGCALVAYGMPVEDALARLRERRGPNCPETEGQLSFIRAFEAIARARRAPPPPLDKDKPNQPGILRRTYEITSWRTWDDEVHGFARDFKERFNVYPNVLLASSATHAHLDMAAKKQHVRGPGGERPDDATYTPLDSFAGPGHSLAFCVDERLGGRKVALIYDSDPGGGLPVPDEDTVVRITGLWPWG
ncbi:MAG: dual specificity protein phosphatase family protein [Deltaproteobacteria bacterium]|nr:dual specificity protein phosphatase family protein [Deltaproteobacteria bacterium]